MCVIVAHPAGKVPARRILEACYAGNSDGIGVAYKRPSGKVKFHRGISFSDMEQLMRTIEDKRFPYILHFRFATIGDRGVARLCHPFPVSKELDDIRKLHGDAQAVLAHNGTWRDMDSAFDSKLVRKLINDDGWSDSALIAWGIGKGKEIRLDQSGYGNRIAMLYGKENFGIDGTGLRLWGRGWVKDDGIWYSNSSWRGFVNRSNRVNFDWNDEYYGESMYYGTTRTRTRDVEPQNKCQTKSCNHPIEWHTWRPEEAKWKRAGFRFPPEHGCRVKGCACMESQESCFCHACVLLHWVKEWEDVDGRYGVKGKIHTPEVCYQSNKDESPDSCALPALPMQQQLEKKKSDTKLTIVEISKAKDGWCACGNDRAPDAKFHSKSKCSIGNRIILLNCACNRPLIGGSHDRKSCFPAGRVPRTFEQCLCGNPAIAGMHSATKCESPSTLVELPGPIHLGNRRGPYGVDNPSPSYSPPPYRSRTGTYVNGVWQYNDTQTPKHLWGKWIEPNASSHASKGGYCKECGNHTYSQRTGVPVCYRKECEDKNPRICDGGCDRVGTTYFMTKFYCGGDECRAEIIRLDEEEEAARKLAEERRKALEEYETGKFEIPGLGTFAKREVTGGYVLTTGITRRTRADAEKEEKEKENSAALLRLEKEWLWKIDASCDMCVVSEPKYPPMRAQAFLETGYFVCGRATCRNLCNDASVQHDELETRLQGFLAFVQSKKPKIETSATSTTSTETKKKPPEEDPGSGNNGGNGPTFPPGFYGM